MAVKVIKARAYSAEQKSARRESIVASAALLFRHRRLEEVTMLDIARETGVAKGTVYVYFRTKEELFLACAQAEIEQFFRTFRARLEALPCPAGPPGVVKTLREALQDRSDMARLLAYVHLVLEFNTEYEQALAFRRHLLPYLAQCGGALERHLPFLQAGSGQRLLLLIHGMTIGFQQLADPSPVIREVQAQADMALYKFDFETALLSTVDFMLCGMAARQHGASGD